MCKIQKIHRFNRIIHPKAIRYQVLFISQKNGFLFFTENL